MAEADSPEIEARSADRVVVFSDAVVAIAITLLALDLPIPGDIGGDRAVLDFLGDHWNAYFAFFISFVVVSGHWGSHRAIFRYVNRINDRVISTNMVWLLMVVLTPFAARTLAASTRGFGVRFGIYALVQAVALTSLVRLGRELAQDHRSGIEKQRKRSVNHAERLQHGVDHSRVPQQEHPSVDPNQEAGPEREHDQVQEQHLMPPDARNIECEGKGQQ